jgi:UDP-glucuronate 4-epimerase
VIGLDNINDYYNPDLKFARLKELGIARVDAELDEVPCLSEIYPNFTFIELTLPMLNRLEECLKNIESIRSVI